LTTRELGSRHADAEWLLGELQREIPRRTFTCPLVSEREGPRSHVQRFRYGFHPSREDTSPRFSASIHALHVEQVFLPIERIMIHAPPCGESSGLFEKPS